MRENETHGNVFGKAPLSESVYEGKDFPEFGIKNGMRADRAFETLMNKLSEVLTSKIDLPGEFEQVSDDQTFLLNDSVKALSERVTKLSTKDLKLDSQDAEGLDQFIPGEIQNNLNRDFIYKVEPQESGTLLSYDLSHIVNNLPNDYVVERISGIVSGKPDDRNRSIIVDTKRPYVGAVIENKRFPLTVDIDMRVKTPQGSVKMYKSFSVPSPKENKIKDTLEVKKFGVNSNESTNVSDFFKQMKDGLLEVKKDMDSLKQVEVAGSEEFEYGSTDIRDLVAKNSSMLSELMKKIEEVDETQFTIKEGNRQEKFFGNSSSAFEKVTSKLGELSEKQQFSESKIKQLEQELKKKSTVTVSGDQVGSRVNGPTPGNNSSTTASTKAPISKEQLPKDILDRIEKLENSGNFNL